MFFISFFFYLESMSQKFKADESDLRSQISLKMHQRQANSQKVVFQ